MRHTFRIYKHKTRMFRNGNLLWKLYNNNFVFVRCDDYEWIFAKVHENINEKENSAARSHEH